MNRLCYLDFEYNSTNEEKFNLNCCSLIIHNDDKVKTLSYWLHNSTQEKQRLKTDLIKLREAGFIFISYNVVAEASCFYSLGVSPIKAKWIDLQVEWAMLSNNNDKYAYGENIFNGEIRTTKPPPPKWERSEEDKESAKYAKAEKNLVSATFKLLGIRLDSKNKDKMRDLILSHNDLIISKNKEEILKYCVTDVEPLHEMFLKFLNIYKNYGVTRDQMLSRGRTSSDVAMMTCYGYPVDKGQMKRFSENVPKILRDLCEDINSQFAEDKFFKYNKKTDNYTKSVKDLRHWISISPYKATWLKTDTGQYSTSLEAFEKFFPYKHDYPRGNVGAQQVRFLKTLQSLNGFRTSASMGKKTIFNSLGSDSRVRAYLNPFGSQTGRFQPKATAFIPLKAAWMRSMIVPPGGRTIVGVDYSSEEFLISALWSKDKNMIESYRSGDVYLFFAKLAGAVPMAGKKEDYKTVRDLFKSSVLGISYLMGAKSLAEKLEADTGVKHTEDMGQRYIDLFNKSYPVFSRKIEYTQYLYIKERRLSLPCGWTMFGDNPNRRSAANFPIQGRGSTILRSAISKALDAGLKIIIPLHDALYMEFDSGDFSKIDLLGDIMKEAFVNCFDQDQHRDASIVRLDFNMW